MNILKGKIIALVRQMTDEEANKMGWFNKPMIIQFTDNTLLIPQCDNEGNDGAAFWYQGKTEKEDYLFYTIR